MRKNSLSRIDSLISDVKKVVTEDDNSSDSPKKEDPKKSENEFLTKPPESDTDELTGLSKQELDEVEGSYKNYTTLMDAISKGDPNAFTEADRPPKDWFDKCVSDKGKDSSVDDPQALCGWIWSRLSSKKQKTIRGREGKK